MAKKGLCADFIVGTIIFRDGLLTLRYDIYYSDARLIPEGYNLEPSIAHCPLLINFGT